MFFTCAPGGSETVGPTSNIAIEASGACSLRMRAYAAPVGPLPTIATSTASGYSRALMPAPRARGCSLTDSADAVCG